MTRHIILCSVVVVVAASTFLGVLDGPTYHGSTVAHAQTSPTSPGGGLVNPLDVDSIEGFLLAIVDIIIIFAVPIIVFFIIYGGFLLVTAQGDTTKIAQARSTLTWAVVGGVIVLGASALVKVIEATVKAF